MPNTRVLVSDQGNVKVYDIVNEEGVIVGQDREQLLSTEEINRLSITKAAQNALVSNKDFLALAPPTQAQVVAQVKALTKHNNALIRLVLNRLETND